MIVDAAEKGKGKLTLQPLLPLRLTVYCGERGTSTSDKMVDADTVKKICDIYDWDGKGELDLFFLGDIMYAMGYNTTKKVCVGLGQTKEDVQKMFAEICDPEDEDGLFPYMSFLDRLTGK